MTEKRSPLINDVVLLLKDNIAIKLTNGLVEPYASLVSGGYANYQNGFVTKNWKTGYWQEPVPETPIPVETRFEILDL